MRKMQACVFLRICSLRYPAAFCFVQMAISISSLSFSFAKISQGLYSETNTFSVEVKKMFHTPTGGKVGAVGKSDRRGSRRRLGIVPQMIRRVMTNMTENERIRRAE
jgi:hypothetical protein